MAQVINTNIPSMNAQKNLNASQASAATTLQRLSTGLRINSAKDDAAGLAISERMTSQIRGMNVAQRNASDGISMVQTAEGGFGKIGDMLQRMRELAVQSANGTNTQNDRDAIQAEVGQLLQEVDRVANQTTFNGKKLLDGSNPSFTFQVGANANETIVVSNTTDANTAALGGAITSSTTQSTAISGLGTGAVVAGSLTVNGTDIGPLSAVGTAQQRADQVVNAINNISETTGVNASINTTTGLIEVSSAATITFGGTDNATLTGFDGAAAQVSTDSTVTGIAGLNVSSFAGSTLAIRQLDAALEEVNTARANMGAIQNRFENTIASINTQSENTAAARSRIQDADFAAESANLSKTQILQQAGTAMLAQANQMSQGVLSLLR